MQDRKTKADKQEHAAKLIPFRRGHDKRVILQRFAVSKKAGALSIERGSRTLARRGTVLLGRLPVAHEFGIPIAHPVSSRGEEPVSRSGRKHALVRVGSRVDRAGQPDTRNPLLVLVGRPDGSHVPGTAGEPRLSVRIERVPGRGLFGVHLAGHSANGRRSSHGHALLAPGHGRLLFGAWALAAACRPLAVRPLSPPAFARAFSSGLPPVIARSSIALADGVRRLALKQTLKIPLAREVFVRPERRIPIVQLFCLITSLALSVVHPVLVLSLGASLLGVPHVVSGIRHIALRRSLHRLSLAMAVLGIGLGAVLLLSSGRWVMHALTLTFAVSVGAEILSSGVSMGRRFALLLALAVITAFALRHYVLFLVGVTHLHAVSSIAFFCVAARRRSVSPLPLAWGGLLAAVGILGGGLDGLLRTFPWQQSFGPDAVVDLIGAPFQSISPALARRSLVLYAFGQSLHYLVWLRLMPEIDRPVPVPWSLRRALRALRADFGGMAPVGLFLCVAGATAMLAGGLQAREIYFALVYFHIGLEAAALTRAALRPDARTFQAVGGASLTLPCSRPRCWSWTCRKAPRSAAPSAPA